MKIKITVYKESGKFYASDIVENDEPIFIYEDEFKQFIFYNLPAIVDDGYVTVTNIDENDSNFYEVLYTMERLKSLVL